MQLVYGFCGVPCSNRKTMLSNGFNIFNLLFLCLYSGTLNSIGAVEMIAHL